MSFLPPDEVLFFPGSLLSTADQFVASYDLENSSDTLLTYRASTNDPRVKHAHSAPFRIDWSVVPALHVINGMGVTLGDSIIGLTALAAIKARYPNIRIYVYRPAHAPRYVEDLYTLASGVVVDRCLPLPYSINRLPADEIIIDVGNHLFWPRFSDTPMIDFFLDALGVDPLKVKPEEKQNQWLRTVPNRRITSALNSKPYALFCPSSTTPLRGIPEGIQAQLVDEIHRAYGIQVLGFGDVDHPAYRDVTSESASTEAFLEWIGAASFVMGGDSAATHVAAGFGIPTTAFFTSIEPELRVRDYGNCFAITLDVPSLRSLQASNREADLQLVEHAYLSVLRSGLRLPNIEI